MMKKLLFLLFYSASFVSCTNKSENEISMIPFESIQIGGELKERVLKNLNRLEEEKYQPGNVFLTDKQSGNWPGDTEGRTILGLVMDARASGREPKYLEEIINLIPSKLNEKGYMGVIHQGKMDEQQLSGNGWMLRGLCAYYEWKQDNKVLEYIKSIANNLYVAGKGYYSEYPVDPDFRDKNVGGESGTTNVKGTDKWILSSDIGCLFIGMDGLIHAYKYIRTAEIKDVIDEMLLKLKEIDVLKIKAQTHATLTACRGLIRYTDITGDYNYVKWAERIFNIYKEHGMTEAHGNYNWFDRFDTWTEPCAIVDSYMLAVQLWMHTENPIYKEDAELIYYNAISHGQRDNGGFGTDNCPGLAINDSCLRPRLYEAHWCCTMRGGEGLGSAVNYSAFTKNDTIYIPFLRECSLNLKIKGGKNLKLSEITSYPFESEAKFIINENAVGEVTLKLPYMTWMNDLKITCNEKKLDYKVENGFINVAGIFKSGDIIKLSFDMEVRKENTINRFNTLEAQYKYYYGPMLLGIENGTEENYSLSFEIDGKQLTPVYHKMSEKIQNVTKDKGLYSKRILFEY